MQVTLEVVLTGNLVLPVSGEVNNLADLAKLGKKLAAMPVGAFRLLPIVRTLAVETIRVTERTGEDAAPRRARGKGKGKRAAHASEESARSAAA